MHVSSACPRVDPWANQRDCKMGGAKWVGEFNKPNSPGSSTSQQKTPMISTSYNWEGVFLSYLRMKFYSFVSGLEKQYNIFIEQKSLQ